MNEPRPLDPPAAPALVVAADPCGRPNPALVAAAGRAGGRGLLDVTDPGELTVLGTDVARRCTEPYWLRPGPAVDPGAVAALAGADAATRSIEAVVVAADAVAAWVAAGPWTVLAQVTSRAEAVGAVAAGAHGLVASGCEAGGRVGDTEAFVLFQQVVDLGVPVWSRGGIGLHTAAAVIAGGGAGVVLDTQLGLLREAGLGLDARSALEAMDGSETRVVGGHRVYTRPDLPAATLTDDVAPAEVAARLGADLKADLVPFGQDGGVAKGLARRFATVGGVVQAVRASVADHLAAAAAAPPLAPGAGVAGPHGTRYPIAQGPMTRVSDRAAFAAAVAEGGGLPFLALALLPAHEVRELLTETAQRLGDRPWGVGVLGFVPADLRAEQLEVVHEIAPPVALIAGGRPSQAAPLEAAGISTYLHVPSPGLLDRFLKDGARKFVFEGRECGGHVGPRSSFALWDAQIERLLDVDDPENLQVLLAGGIHDARSAAMAAAACAPLAARGAKVGVLMGTAYLFTEEAVAGGAIQPAFQDVAVHCDTTVLLETAPGHATRCVETEFVRAFAARKAELEAEGVDPKERWAELETLNLGRLRIASKGIVRDESGLVTVDPDHQRREGMYMIGEVATLRHEVTTVAALHADVSEGSAARATGTADGSPVPRLSVREPERGPDPLDVAIVGMDAFFPGAVGAEEFWAEIVAGTDAVTEVPAGRWDVDRYYDADAFTRDAGRKTPSKWGGFLRRIGFDPLRYGIPPASLAAIEPVQLLSLEVAARALADAGYAEREFDRSRASVIFGTESGNELGGAYGVRAFLPQLFGDLPPALEEWLPSLTEDSFPGVLANVIAGRIANRLDLGGVNYTVDAACASSLAALDAACKELRLGTSDLVLCGGADLHNGLNDYLLFASVHALSPTGRCRTFDASADGIALGEGVACVVLKRLADAERDGDRIYAVIDAVAGSSDGRHLGLTAPRKEGQQRAVHRALAQAGHPPASIGLVEAHGTGTVVGDRTEMATLTEVFADAGVAPGATVLGSVKSQIGHTKCAAGLAGLIKVAKAVHHGVLPPTVNLVEPNPYYDAETSPFRFLHQSRPWAAETRRAGVSAFGFGGTNFHAVVSSYDAGDRPAHGAVQWPAELFLVRGATPADADRALDQLAATVAAVVAADPDGQRHPLRDLAHAVCRAGSGPVRAAFVAGSLTELAAAVEQARSGTADPGAGVFLADPEVGADTPAPTVGFLYPGQGSQRPGMLADLFVTFGGLDDLLRLGERWAPQLFPPAAFTREERAAQQEAITATDVAQPTLGIAALALTRLLGRLGVRPAVAGGHSYGELAALAAAGSFDDATLLELSAARGGSILEAVERSGGDPGTMAAVALTREELVERLATWPDLVLANHNGPRQAVLSGPTATVHEAVAALQADGVQAKVLPVACAFHSPLIAEAGELLAARLAELPVAAPSFPVWSNVTAEPYPEGDPAAVARLLTEQVTAGVRFVDQVEAMYDAGVRVFVEAGPGRVLTQQVGRILGDRPHAMVACDVAGEPGVRRFLTAVAHLAALGVPVDPTTLFEGRSAPADLHALPVPAPNWQVDGALVCNAAGVPLPNSLQPAHLLPTLDFGAHAMTTAADDPSGVVLEYLRSVRQIVAAERDVMLRYLGSTVPATAAFDDYAGVIEGAAQPALAPSVVHGPSANGSSNGSSANGAVNGSPVNDSPVNGSAADGQGTPAPALTGEQLLHEVQAIVSERTGYPVEMLDPDLDLEADLSIDSIKRIEIVGELAERIGLAGLDESAVDEEMVEELAQHKSLRAIVEWIEALATGEASPATAESVAAAHAAHEPEHAHGPLPPVAQRFEVRTTLLGPAVALGDLRGSAAGVVEGHAALTDAVVAALSARGAAVTRVERGAPVPDRAELLAGFDVVVDLTATAGDPAVDARSVFADLQPALLGATRRALAVTVPVHADGTPTGIPGLMRALARERHDALVRAVELEPADLEGDLEPLAEILVDELLDLDAPAALSWAGGQRAARVVGEPRDLAVPGELGLGPEAVVVLTGGARGITARVAEGLARANPCHLVLVGRSAFSERDEDPRTAGAADRQAIRRALLEIGDLRTPSEIEAACNRIEADREMRATLATLRSFGAEVEYVSLDVRDPRFGDLLDELRDRHGRLDGVIHGAGVLDDHFLRDKTLAGFDRVFGTKLDGARAILDRQAGMRFVVLFGSVSGVFGNKGQADYAAANDALDTLARTRDGLHDCRVISLDWGPWGGGGMVSAELEREYARRGIGLVDPADGVMALLHEVAAGSGPSQLVVMRGTPEAFAPPIDHTLASDDLVGGTRGDGRDASVTTGPGVDPAGDGIAIVGMACLYPGAPTVERFWSNIRTGFDAITEVPAGRWDPVFFDPDGKGADRFYCNRGGFVDDLATFDPLAFGIMPVAMESAEPDQLLALGAAAAALADAGGVHERVDPTRVAVILGRGGYIGDGVARLDQRVRTAQQLVETLRSLLPGIDDDRLQAVKAEFQDRLGPERPEGSIGLVPNLAASRIANRFDFQGPAYTVDAACASSLIAVDQAADQLRSGRADVVLAGGVHHCHDLTLWSVFSQLRALSPSGAIRPFSEAADGILVGEGTGIVVLKRLADAERDGDRVYAVIRGTGVASDGRDASLMSPRPEGQVLAVEAAWRASGLDPAAVGLIEAHGTATPVGDRTELETLHTVFGAADPSRPRAGLGSVKSMIGHAMPAAGAAGLIKAALAVYHGELPPTLHVEEPAAAVADTRFRLVTEVEPWEGDGPRLAGVNAFGFGGINAHVVLAEPPGLRTRPARPGAARTATPGSATSAGTSPDAQQVDAPEAATPAEEDVLLLAGADAADLLAQLDGWTAGDPVLRVPAGGPARLAVVAPDDRRLTLARKVLERGTAFRGRNDVWFDPHGLVSSGGKVAFLFPGVEPVFAPHVDDVAERFGLAWEGLPADVGGLQAQGRGIVAVGRLLADALDRLGIRADAMAGHSLGEWTGQIVSGMIPTASVEEFLTTLQPGSVEVSDVVFVALGTGADVAAELVAGLPDAYVSHDNCPHQSVVCAPEGTVAAVLARAKERKVLAQELPFRSGFHSPLFAPYVAGLAEQFGTIPVVAPTVPMWSATSVAPYPDDADASRELAGRHLVEPVRFRQLAEALVADGVRAFVQVGTGSLNGFLDDTLRDHDVLTVSANTAKQTGVGQLRRVAAALWSAGVPVDFAPLGHRVEVAGGPVGVTSGAGQGGGGGAADGGARPGLPLVLGSTLVRGLRPLDLGGVAGGGASAGPALGDVDWPAVHDADRPDAPAALLAELRATLHEAGAAARTVLDAAEEARRSPGRIARPAPRRTSAGRVTPAARVAPEATAASGAVSAGPTGSTGSTSPDVREVTWELSVADQPWWRDHSFYEQPPGWPCLEDEFPLVPMTGIIEMLAAEAEALVPGTVAVRVESIRAFRWLAVEPPASVAVRAVIDHDATAAAPVGTTVVKTSVEGHARAVVHVAAAHPPSPDPAAGPVHGEIPVPVAPERIYVERHLFHGPEYQGIRSLHFGTDGVTGRLESQPAPGALLDNAGQLFGLWMATRVDRDRLVLPTSIDRISFYGPRPEPGTPVDCVVNCTSLTDQAVRADLELTVDGVVWCRIEGWEDRRFQSDDRLFLVLRKPKELPLAEEQPGGWVLVREGWPDSASRDVVMRRFLGQAERADYAARNPNVQRTWLLGRIAAKDAVRTLLWSRGFGPIFPVEVTVTNDDRGRPQVAAPVGADVRVSIAHTAGLGVALAAEGVDVGIDIERVEPRPASFEAAALTPGERDLLAAGPAEERDRTITRWWAAKEAAAKAQGTGMDGRPRDFEVIEDHRDRLRIGHRWLATRTLTDPAGPSGAAEPQEHVVAWTIPEPRADEPRGG